MSSGLTRKDLEALGNMERELSRKLSKVFSALLGKTAILTFRKVTEDTAAGAGARLPKKGMILPFTVEEKTQAVWAIAPKIGMLVGDLLVGEKSEKLPEEMTEQHKDACAQVFAKIVEAQAAALTQLVDKKFTFASGEARLGPAADAVKSLSDGKEGLAVYEYGLGIEGYFEDAVYMILPLSFARQLSSLAETKVSGRGGKIESLQLGQLSGSEKVGSLSDVSLLLDTPLHLTVELGRAKMSLKNILELGIGSIVELDKLAGESVDIKVNNKMLAKGEVVVIDDNFGVRIVNIVKPNERI